MRRPRCTTPFLPPAEARRLADRFEWHYTPTHGSWLNLAEIELSVLARQCLARRIADPDTLATEVAAWVARRNAAATPIAWRFTLEVARVRLRRLSRGRSWHQCLDAVLRHEGSRLTDDLDAR
jgi:hypothetical protein